MPAAGAGQTGERRLQSAGIRMWKLMRSKRLPFAGLMPSAVLMAALWLMPLGLTGCSGVEKATPRPQAARVDMNTSSMDIPRMMRGTVASEAMLDGYRPVVARGYGLVVGLSGTGSREVPPQLRAHMIQEMSRRGIGSEREGFGHIKPEQMLNSEDTAVVVVEAVIPPAAVQRRSSRGREISGTRFDVRIYADPRTGTSSLEGGRLYTTELRPGPLRTGGAEAAPIARARGPVFVNPFAEPGAIESDTVTRTSGVILNGGESTRDMPLKLRLFNPSHIRAAILQDAINTRFPQERGQREQTARGESDSSIAITVPPSYRNRTEEFVTLLEHMTIRQADIESIAVSVRRALLADPADAMTASWRWQALGERALPVIKELYDYPEELPRLAALRAGAKLNDGLVINYLIDMARTGSLDNRLMAIELLGEMPTYPRINSELHALLNDEDVDVRLTAYEALVERNDPRLRRYAVDRKFVVDVVESDHPMIYITQFGQPRVVLFGGEKLKIDRPVFVQAWSNRFMVKDLEDSDELEVFFRKASSDERGEIHRVEPILEDFVQFLGHTTTVEKPAAGLGMSYGEAVGALYQIWRQDYIRADFKAEQDRILAAIMRQEEESDVTDRPEFADEESPWAEFDPETAFSPISDLDRISPRRSGQGGSDVPRRRRDSESP